MTDAFKSTLDAALQSRMAFIRENKERLLEAWIAATGLGPDESVLVERHMLDGSTRMWVERKRADDVLVTEPMRSADDLEAKYYQLAAGVSAVLPRLRAALALGNDLSKHIALAVGALERALSAAAVSLVEPDAAAAPRFAHECTNCTWLGRHHEYDLYHCTQSMLGHPTLVVRYGDDSQDYTSFSPDVVARTVAGFSDPAAETLIEALVEARRRAAEHGLL